MKNINELVGKVVAVRGVGSGVNVGVCTAVTPDSIILMAGNFYLRSWKYPSGGFGSFHSLANGQITGGENICEVSQDSVIFHAEHVVVCSDELPEKLKKWATK